MSSPDNILYFFYCTYLFSNKEEANPKDNIKSLNCIKPKPNIKNLVRKQMHLKAFKFLSLC